jgi:hypothetical protein
LAVAGFGEAGLIVFKPPKGFGSSFFASSGFGAPKSPPLEAGVNENVGLSPNRPCGLGFSAGASALLSSALGAAGF